MVVHAVGARFARAVEAAYDLASDGLDVVGGEVIVAEAAGLAANAFTFDQVGAWVTGAWVARGAKRGVVGHADSRVVLAFFFSSDFGPRSLALLCFVACCRVQCNTVNRRA